MASAVSARQAWGQTRSIVERFLTTWHGRAIEGQSVRQATLGPRTPANDGSLWETDNAAVEVDDERKAVDARRMVRVKGAIECVERQLSIILFIFIDLLPHVLSSPSCLSLSSPHSILLPLQNLPAVPPLASPFYRSPPSLQRPQHPGLFQSRNRLNCTLLRLIL